MVEGEPGSTATSQSEPSRCCPRVVVPQGSTIPPATFVPWPPAPKEPKPVPPKASSRVRTTSPLKSEEKTPPTQFVFRWKRAYTVLPSGEMASLTAGESQPTLVEAFSMTDSCQV